MSRQWPRCLLLALSFVPAIDCSSLSAASAPAQLRGKAFNLSWTDNRVEKVVSTGRERALTQNSAVSVEGRFFSHFSRTVGRGFTDLKEVSGAGRNALNWRQEGASLAADQKFLHGARRLIVSFDGSYSGCTLRVLHGKEAGSSTIQYLTMDTKLPVELTSINVTSTSCSITAGNPFS